MSQISPLQTIGVFLEAINRNDKTAILSFFDEQSRFHNVPMGEVQGPDGIWGVLAGVHDIALAVDWQILRLEQAPSGVVYSERNDRYRLPDGRGGSQWAEFRCAGIHEVDDNGKIRLWRDYFDLQQSLATMP